MGSSFSSHKMFLHYFEVFEDPYCCSPLLSLLLKLGCFLTEHCGGGHRNFSGCICKFADFEFCAFGFKSSELGLNSTYVALFLLKVLGYLDVLPIVKKSVYLKIFRCQTLNKCAGPHISLSNKYDLQHKPYICKYKMQKIVE